MNWDQFNEVGVPFPTRPAKPVLKRGATPAEHRAHADTLEQHDKLMREYSAAYVAYCDARAKRDAEFRLAVLTEYGLIGHPKADDVYQLAWEEGHAGGYNEIAMWVCRLSDLVK